MSTLRFPRVSPDLIGREAECRALGRLVEQVATGTGAVLLLTGEAGVGKSRLVSELRRLAEDRGLAVLVGHCYAEDETVPLAALAELAGVAGLDSADEPEAGRALQTRSLTRVIEAEATRRPHCLVLEDVHWSDEASLEVIGRLSRRVADLPLLLALTYRPDHANAALREFLDEIDRRRLALELAVGPLTATETGVLVQRILGMPRLPRREMTEALHGLTEGNPFFVEETLNALVDGGQIDPSSDSWDAGVLDQLRPPRAVQHAVQRQLERVDQRTRHILTLASVMGRRFDLDALAAVDGREVSDLLPEIRQAVEAQLVVEEPDGLLQFRHALTREAIYSDLLARERQQLHLAVARSLERQAQGEGAEGEHEAAAAILAHHYYRAREWEAALEWSRRAADTAGAMSAPRAEATMLGQAMQAAEQLGRPVAASMLRRRAAAREVVGNIDGARDDYERALSQLRAEPEPRSRESREEELSTLLGVGMLWSSRDYGPARRHYLEALELARSLGDPLLLARALNHLGNWEANAGDPAVARQHHEEALALVEAIGDRRAIAETVDLLSIAAAMDADYAASTTYFQRAISAAEELGDLRMLGSLLSTACGFAGATETGATWIPPNLEWGLPEGERALRIAREVDWPAGEAYALTNLATVQQLRGEFGIALEQAVAALSAAEAVGHDQWITCCLVALGTLEVDLFRPDEAREHLARGYERARGLQSRYWEMVARVHRAALLLIEGDAAAAARLLDEADPPPLINSQDGRLALLMRGRAALRLDDAEKARDLAQRLIDTSAGGPDGVMPHVSRLLGEALGALGEPEAARRRLEEGRELARTFSWKPEVWRASCALARLLEVSGDTKGAAEEWQAARQTLDEIAATIPADEDRQRFLERAAEHERMPRHRTDGERPAGLTPREHEVLSLIASGLSNAEIAERLVIERRTVETHVAHIFRKTDVSTRPQAIRWALDQGIGSELRQELDRPRSSRRAP